MWDYAKAAPESVEEDAPERDSGVLHGALVDIGREITRLTVVAERAGDYEAVEALLREKDRIHRLRRELSNG